AALDAVIEAVPELEDWRPLVADVLGVSGVPETPATAELEAQFRRERIQWIVVEQLRAVITDPTIIVIDDAQWMDDVSVELLSAVSAAARTSPWLFCVARHNVETGFRATDEVATWRLTLTPLDDDAAESLIATATKGSPLP